MKRLALSLLLTLGTGFLALFQQGCGTVHWVVVAAPTPTPSLPNASRIELRMGNQQNRIVNAVQMGNLDESVADGLAQNIGDVQQWEMAYLQSKNSPYQDLTPAETRWLDRMLDDNSLAIDDAIRRNQAWVRLFRGESIYEYDFNSESDRRLFTAYLHYRLKAQRQRINEYEQSGELSADQCDALRRKVDAMGEMEKDYYRKNGKMGFSRTQMRQMKDSLERSSRDFKQLEVKHGRPASLPTPTPAPLFKTEDSQNQDNSTRDNRWDRHGKKDRRNFQKWEEPTPTPTMPSLFKQENQLESQNQDETGKDDRWNNRNHGRKNKRDFSHRDGGEKENLDQVVPAATPTPEASVKQAATPVGQSRGETGRDRVNRNWKGKKDRKNPVQHPAGEKQEQAKPTETPADQSIQGGDNSDKTKQGGRNKHGKEEKGEKAEPVVTPVSDSPSNPPGDPTAQGKKDSGDSHGQDAPKGQQ